MTPTAGKQAVAAPDILTDLSARNGIPGECRVKILRRDRPDLAEQYDRALAAGRFSDRAIADWISDHGFTLGMQVVSRHRRRECFTCQR